MKEGEGLAWLWVRTPIWAVLPSRCLLDIEAETDRWVWRSGQWWGSTWNCQLGSYLLEMMLKAWGRQCGITKAGHVGREEAQGLSLAAPSIRGSCIENRETGKLKRSTWGRREWRPGRGGILETKGRALRTRKSSAVSNAHRTNYRWPETRLPAWAKQRSWVLNDPGQSCLDAELGAEAWPGYWKREMEKDWDRREDSSCQSFVIKEKRSKKAAEKEGRIALVGCCLF